MDELVSKKKKQKKQKKGIVYSAMAEQDRKRVGLVDA
jgi:hypothetical protein